MLIAEPQRLIAEAQRLTVESQSLVPELQSSVNKCQRLTAEPQTLMAVSLVVVPCKALYRRALTFDARSRNASNKLPLTNQKEQDHR